MLKELGIVVGNNTKAAEIFESLYPNFFDVPYTVPSEYVSQYWSLYCQQPTRSQNLNGKIFELILATLCVREGIAPIFLSAKVAFVPNVVYDIMFYTKERGPICWSVKTSLRERYKQADLEALALKNVHRKALTFLITLEENEAKNVKAKIVSGDVVGLNDVIVATSTEFDSLVSNLKSYEFAIPPIVKVIESTQIINNKN